MTKIVVYDITRYAENRYAVGYFERSDLGISPDQMSPSMSLSELMEFLKDAEACTEACFEEREPSPTICAGVVCKCHEEGAFCPAHGRKSNARK